MTLGVATTAVANVWLDLFGSASQSGWATPFLKLHTGDPGAAGTANASAETTRKALALAAASGGSKSATGTPVASWPSWPAGTETISHLSIWTAATAGTFLASLALAASKVVNATDTFNITALTLQITNLAA